MGTPQFFNRVCPALFPYGCPFALLSFLLGMEGWVVGGGGDGGLLCLPFEFLLGSFWGVPWRGFGGLLNFSGAFPGKVSVAF